MPCQAQGAHKLTTISKVCMCHQIVVTLTAIPYQMLSSSFGLRKANLPATWFIFFKWLISFLSVTCKINYNGGYGLVAIPGKWPAHKQWKFWCPEIFSLVHTAQYLWVSQTQEKWPSEQNTIYSSHKNDNGKEWGRVSLSTVTYFQNRNKSQKKMPMTM